MHNPATPQMLPLVVKVLFVFFQDMRFNHDIDARTGYKTHSLLCMPIKDFNGEVMGVAQVNGLRRMKSVNILR